MKIMSCHDVLTTAKMLLEIVDWLPFRGSYDKKSREQFKRCQDE